ncbi:BMC domain-containing protein [Paramaledivibacter caminithermalis]|jgi:microcompartment protein CcmL/EutN|uniref:BMC domain-containing protein n=1 Tax=Paramaledivibacter caminithermalis (strain DSM 15212 / CIP 107654 / DViRD3) TaxID=1121301 RepID=A0A1M6P4R6_PARC5|nr:BMC domain-containing protein [Paramaledivibacter caminithermalis]SHK02959.1 BMC domain-containing protein [Paramaledivibacter caminithermalis DSM 15212]
MMNSKGRALGMLEVCGYSTALIVINEIYHHMDIKVVAININKPAVAILEKIPLQAQVKFIGTLDQVNAALELGYKVALKYNEPEDIISDCIPNPHEGIEKMIKAW